jgi:histidine triad (HIT) family protein
MKGESRMNPDCIFCKIVAGKLPCCKVYEDADTLAFMDIGPIVKGHTLVIPKQHYDPLTRTPAEVLGKLIAVVQKVAAAQERALKTDGVNVIQSNGRAAGQVVPHIHFHVIPRFQQDGHSWNWRAKSYAEPQEMQRLGAAIQQAME